MRQLQVLIEEARENKVVQGDKQPTASSFDDRTLNVNEAKPVRPVIPGIVVGTRASQAYPERIHACIGNRPNGVDVAGVCVDVDCPPVGMRPDFPACLCYGLPFTGRLAFTSLTEADYPIRCPIQMGQRHFYDLRDCRSKIYPLLRGWATL